MNRWAVFGVVVVIATAASSQVWGKTLEQRLPRTTVWIDTKGTQLFDMGERKLAAAHGEDWKYSEGLFAVVDLTRNKWGYINIMGDWVIGPRFSGAHNFSDGLALVRAGDQYVYIDKTGQTVLALPAGVDYYFRGDEYNYFHEGLALVHRKGRPEYIDKEGKVSIKLGPEVEYASKFSEGLARIKVGRKWGFIDRTGAVVIEPQFEDVLDFSDGLAHVTRGSSYGYIDRTGAMVIESRPYDIAGSFFDGLAIARRGGVWWYMDKRGAQALDVEAEDAQVFSGGLAVVQMGGKWGYMNTSGQIVIRPQFTSAGEFADGVAVVTLD